MNAALADIDPAPTTVCRLCGKDMPAAHLICAWCHADGKHHTREDIQARNRRITEALLWS